MHSNHQNKFAHCTVLQCIASQKDQGWAFAHFENEISLIFVALFKRAKKERLLIRSFAKSDEKSNHSIVLLKRANPRAIAQSLF